MDPRTYTSGTSSCAHTMTSQSATSSIPRRSSTSKVQSTLREKSEAFSSFISPMSPASARLHRRFGANRRRASSHCVTMCAGHTTSVLPSKSSDEPSRVSDEPSRSCTRAFELVSSLFFSRARNAAQITVFPAPTGCAMSPPGGSRGARTADVRVPRVSFSPLDEVSAAASAFPIVAYGPE